MNDIILPWSCDTHDKICNILKWCWLFGGFTFPVIFGITLSINPNYPTFLFNFGVSSFVATIIFGFSWLIQFCIWWGNGDLPSIRCRDST